MTTEKNSEWLTRKRLIDPQLKGAGWKVTPYSADPDLAISEPLAIEEFPTDNGPADYALCVDGRILGIVEAKKLTLGPQNILTHSTFDSHHVPFLYSTNAEVIWYHDIRRPLNRSRRITHVQAGAANAGCRV